MNEPLPIRSVDATSGPLPQRAAARDERGALAFKALLDELDQRAHALEVESHQDLSKDDLAGAVDNARISLEQMLNLKDQLIEAWRASQLERPSGLEGERA